MFELAAESEAAADNLDVAAIDKNHDKMIDMYEKIVKVIRDNIDLGDKDSSDDEILEFSPDL